MTGSDTTAFLNINFTVRFDIEGRSFTTQTLRNEGHGQFIIADFKGGFFEEQVQNVFGAEIHRTQNDRSR